MTNRSTGFKDSVLSILGGSRFSRGGRAAGVLVLGLACLAAPVVHAQGNSPGIEETRSALEKWVENERLISKEKRDLELKREMLNERIELVRREIETLREKIKDTEGSIAEADKKREELIAENEKLKEASTSLQSILVSLEDRTKELLGRMPSPIVERVKPLSQRLPKEGEETKLSLSERFQNVVGILNEVNKFHREITVTSEVRELPDGTSAEVTAVYLGIGKAFYAGANGQIAGVGTAEEDAWVWESNDDAAEQISQVIAILKNEQVAAFVRVPMEID